MVSRNTSILLAVAIIAIGAVAIIGVAYAYTASTDNTGNTSGSEYIVLSQGDAVANYSGAFNVTVKYDTVREIDNSGDEPAVVTTYTLTAGQTKVVDTDVSAVCLGEKTITVDASKGANYIFSVANKSATGISAGTFYIGIKVGSAAEKIRLFTPTTNTENFYMTGDGTAAATVKTDATSIDKGTTSIVVKLYYVVSNTHTLVTPLTNVTFEFKAEPYVPPTP